MSLTGFVIGVVGVLLGACLVVAFVNASKNAENHREQNMNKCVICKQRFDGHGNNAEPVAKGLCCDTCNMSKVIPARLMMMANARRQDG